MVSSGSQTGPHSGAGQAPDEGAHLARRASEGDLEAFEALYRSHVHRVYALCLRMSGDAGHAERLVQDTFVLAWRKRASFRGEAAFGTWLHRIAVNAVLTDRRSRGRRQARLDALEEDPEAIRATPPADPGTRMDLERAIQALPEGARDVFVLHEIEGFTHEEIAEMSGIAVGTSKAQLHRARSLLKDRLT